MPGKTNHAPKKEKKMADRDNLNYLNLKRTYDEYQDLSLERARILNQHLANTVETANMVAKQAVRHSEIAIDRQWNVDEQGYTAAKIISSLQDPAVIAAMAAKIAEVMAEE